MRSSEMSPCTRGHVTNRPGSRVPRPSGARRVGRRDGPADDGGVAQSLRASAACIRAPGAATSASRMHGASSWYHVASPTMGISVHQTAGRGSAPSRRRARIMMSPVAGRRVPASCSHPSGDDGLTAATQRGQCRVGARLPGVSVETGGVMTQALSPERAAVPYITLKLLALVPAPAGVVTLIVPELAPAGTVAVIRVAELTVNAAEVPLNLTAVAPVKFAPFTATLGADRAAGRREARDPGRHREARRARGGAARGRDADRTRRGVRRHRRRDLRAAGDRERGREPVELDRRRARESRRR